MKEYHISVFDNESGTKYFLTQNINRKGIPGIDCTLDTVHDIFDAWKYRYILEVGDKVVDIFGEIVTIKEILRHAETQTTNYLIEENGNCYQPSEFAGLFIKEFSKKEFEKIFEKK